MMNIGEVNQEYHDVTRAPSGESPRVSSSSVAGGDDELETDDYSTTPYTPSLHLTLDSPLFFSPHSQWQALSPAAVPQPLHYAAKQKPSPLSVIGSKLTTLLATSRLPAEYANLTSQLIDLHLYKSHAFTGSKASSAAAEQEIAHRASVLETELNRLSNRSSFDNLFSSALGVDFDPTAFLAASSSVGNDMNQYNSPMAMWSPDLMSDAMSTFSGSSAPTSPAAPLLAMASNSYSLNEFLGYGGDAQQQSLFESSYMPMQSLPQPMQTSGMDALGLSNNDYLFGEVPTYNTPSISLLPPTRSGTMEMDLMPAKMAPSASTSSFQDADPFQIHHETCVLLLQAILSNDNSPSFDSTSPFSLDSSTPVEDCLQNLTSKFSPLARQTQQGIPTEYLFSATLAGAMSSSKGRQAFFGDIVHAIERNLGTGVGYTLLNEVWAQ